VRRSTNAHSFRTLNVFADYESNGSDVSCWMEIFAASPSTTRDSSICNYVFLKIGSDVWCWKEVSVSEPTRTIHGCLCICRICSYDNSIIKAFVQRKIYTCTTLSNMLLLTAGTGSLPNRAYLPLLLMLQ